MKTLPVGFSIRWLLNAIHGGKMRSYDSLLESDPEFQQRMAEAKQESAIIVVEARFPNLVEFARRRIVLLNKIDELNTVTRLIASAPDEKAAHWVLDTFAA